jgi:very-short-patch-repair endonuclease
MEKYDIKVIRFTNKEVEEKIENVINRIIKAVGERLKSPPGGGGE